MRALNMLILKLDAHDDVDVRFGDEEHCDGDLVLKQHNDVVIVPKSDAKAFAEALLKFVASVEGQDG